MKSEEGGALQGRLCILGYAWATMPSKHLACGFLREAMRYTSFVLFLCCLMVWLCVLQAMPPVALCAHGVKHAFGVAVAVQPCVAAIAAEHARSFSNELMYAAAVPWKCVAGLCQCLCRLQCIR
jgi:hypothetical protein